MTNPIHSGRAVLQRSALPVMQALCGIRWRRTGPEDRPYHRATTPLDDLRWVDPQLERVLSEPPVEFEVPLLTVDQTQRAHEESATALGCPVRTVHSQLLRARRILRGALIDSARQHGCCSLVKRT